MMISLDTETTGIDFRHGAKPYLVTICDEMGENTWWEWEVDPLTREPVIVYEDLQEIQAAIDEADCIVLQNAKFDVAALRSVFLGRLRWDWAKVYDTLLAGHLLASNQPHDLTSMALEYLGIDLKPYEEAIREATNHARRLARKYHSDWRIAKTGLECVPSAKGSVWKYDMWLPREIAASWKVEPDIHIAPKEWTTLVADYANSDSSATLALFKVQRELLKKRGLWSIYKERLKLLPIVQKMEGNEVTLSGGRLEELEQEYSRESSKAADVCVRISKSYGVELKLPKSGNNKALVSLVFNHMGIVPLKRSKKTGEPSLDKATLEWLETELPGKSRALQFVRNLKAKRKCDTALNYMEGYRRFWLPIEGKYGWYRLHPSLNITGTDTLRWSSQNPNEQNISKQEGFNLRYCFGPAPGREWWSLDAKNIELRIPAYEAEETEMVELFERPDDPPFYGSNHLLVFSILHPEMWAKHGADCKKLFASTWYQWTKNGNFAVQYGAVESSGTADRAYHVEGAQHRIQARFSRISALNARLIDQANKTGYVETIPDKTVDPNRGYPLLCTRSTYGKVLPTVPLNYHVQGTAMWWMARAMVSCQRALDDWSRGPRKYRMIMQVHDELVFDFPKGETPRHNLAKVEELQHRMERCGEGIGIPTPVSIEYHPVTWSEGVSV